ncbi:MAG: T9SS type A sorting domain-containing protein [Flavobacteriales bacterium]|nr:T9SS type A sorting domain-containing protein [Flavobacteriales bacterium]
MRISAIITVLIISASFHAQCYPDRHNTTWFDGWVSCEVSPNPITDYGETHWIQYDLGHQYLLGELSIWNHNDPDNLPRGVDALHVDYSEDGQNWSNLGTFNVPAADGTSIYEGDVLTDFNSEQARYVLLTVESTHGAPFCAGFSELKIGVEGVVTDITEFQTPDACFDVSIYPNPHRDIFNARIRSQCGGQMNVMIHDAMGRLVDERFLSGLNTEEFMTFDNAELPAGIYYLTVQQADALGRYQIVRTR